MKKISLLCMLILISPSYLSLDGVPFDDFFKNLDLDEQTKDDLEDSSPIRKQVTELTEDLKNLNTELKKIIGADAEKQISESKKRRLEKQKEAERKLKDRTISAGKYPTSSYGSRSGYHNYGPAYSPSSASRHDYTGGLPWGTEKLDENKLGKDKIGDTAKAPESTPKLKDDLNGKKNKKSYKSETEKEEKQTLKKIKGKTKTISDKLKHILVKLGEVHTPEEKKLTAKEKVYSDILTGESLTELKIALNARKEDFENLRAYSEEAKKKEASKSHKKNKASRFLSQTQGKTKAITPERIFGKEEISLWNQFLPHMMNMLAFDIKNEKKAGMFTQNIAVCRGLMLNLEEENVFTHEKIKYEQERVEREILAYLNKAAKDKMALKYTEIKEKLQNNFPLEIHDTELLKLLDKLELQAQAQENAE